MKYAKVFSLIVMILWLALCASRPTLPVSAQEEGCPAEPVLAQGQPLKVIESISLAPYIPETFSIEPHQTFYSNTVEVIHDPNRNRVYLSGTANGQGKICTDDLIRLNTATWQFKLDLRSEDRRRIIHSDPIDISHLLTVGSNQLQVELVNLDPSFYSASPLWLVIAEAVAPATVAPPTETPAATPTLTPTALPPATIAPTATISPAIKAQTTFPLEVRVVTEADSFPEQKVWFWGSSTLAAALILTGLALFLLLWRQRNRPILPPGEIKIYRNGAYVQHYVLAQFGQVAVNLGQSGDIPLADETLPPLMARIRAQRQPEGEVEAVLDTLDAEDPEVVVDTRPLRHGDWLNFGSLSIHYLHYAQQSSAQLEEVYDVQY